ncbi:pilus assembly PilX family protein [Solilutibacter silvestris]|uniref:Tfp pilus assembly protein PilX n=1 Tax=Solilutibacter silvestris TaxID=1645665 RepID=A0A2K1Q336_9GAMM|nr:PilX N-terminal domain-containing pilus assembly protein [Lysobacter silvestris]PNS09466.1 Tfp pilus assembly protein PilX [Lysobacter silvestris]
MNRNLPNRNERGAALIVVLMLLVIVTLLGLVAMREAILQERMAGYTIARGYAFQAAEEALRVAEDFAKGHPAIPTSGCNNGVCATPATGQASLYETQSSFWTTAGNYQNAAVDPNGITPKFSLEGYGTKSASGTLGDTCFGDGCVNAGSTVRAQVYRITVLSQAPNGTEVMLQSLYQAP